MSELKFTCLLIFAVTYEAIGTVVCAKQARGMDFISAAIVWHLWPVWCLVILRKSMRRKPGPAKGEVGFDRF